MIKQAILLFVFLGMCSKLIYADLISLDCEVKDDDGSVSIREFDIDRDNKVSEKRIPSTGGAWTNLSTQMAPSQITITHEQSMVNMVHRINRKDLSYEESFMTNYGGGISEGQCKVVERDVVENLI
jgi:hypothetical protein